MRCCVLLPSRLRKQRRRRVPCGPVWRHDRPRERLLLGPLRCGSIRRDTRAPREHVLRALPSRVSLRCGLHERDPPSVSAWLLRCHCRPCDCVMLGYLRCWLLLPYRLRCAAAMPRGHVRGNRRAHERELFGPLRCGHVRGNSGAHERDVHRPLRRYRLLLPSRLGEPNAGCVRDGSLWQYHGHVHACVLRPL